jgi:uncharacterized protein YhaN
VTLQTIAQLERKHRDAIRYSAAIERLDYLAVQLSELQRELRQLRRSAAVLRHAFHDQRGIGLWRQAREELVATMPRQMSSPARALSEADSMLLRLAHYLGAASARVGLRTTEVAGLLEAHLAQLRIANRGLRPVLRVRLDSFLHELGTSEAFVPPKSRAELLAKLGLNSRSTGAGVPQR